MKNIANLFIVNTPFQLINALEARDVFQSQINILIIQLNHNNNSSARIQDILSREKKFEIIFDSNTYSKGSRTRYAKILKTIKSQFKIQNLFVGHFKRFNNQIAFAYLRPNQFFLLDDGVATTTTTQCLYISQSKMEYDAPFKSRLLKWIRFALRGVISPFPTQLYKYTNLFTSYHYLKPYSQNQKVVYHSFEHFLSTYKPKTAYSHSESHIIFIGQPIHYILKNQADYMNFFSKIKERFADKHIIYIAHSLDSAEFLEQLKNNNWEVQELEQIIEIALITSDKQPTQVISFCSSALLNLATMLPNISIYAIDICPFVDSKFIEEIKVVYEYLYKNKRIKRLQLEIP